MKGQRPAGFAPSGSLKPTMRMRRTLGLRGIITSFCSNCNALPTDAEYFMPNAAMCWAHEHKLPHLEKWTLVLIADWANQDGFGSTTISRLSEEGGMTDVEANRAILKLNSIGVLKILHISGFDKDKKYEYKLDWRMD